MDNENLKGTVENIIFINEENGYAIFNFSGEHGKITCRGSVFDLVEGEMLVLSGRHTVHPSYGRQFEFNAHERKMPNTVDSIEKYLGSGVVKGIGAKLAKRIVDKFKEDTFIVIEEHPETLSKVKGISLKKANEIREAFCGQIVMRETLLTLQKYDIGSNLAKKIYDKYKEKTIWIIKNDPYSLIYSVFGIGFIKADKIAESVGISSTSESRIKAGIIYTLNEAANRGHVYLPKTILLEQAIETLKVNQALVEDMIVVLAAEREIYIQNLDNRICVYQKFYYYFETFIAKKLIEISKQEFEPIDDIDRKILKFQKKSDIILAEQQLMAVKEAVKSGVMVITGGPGTGKTTIIKTIIHILENDNLEIYLAAPTGRAAKKMTEATGKEAKTLHRLLKLGVNEETSNKFYMHNSDEVIDADVLIVDESSMIDISLMNSLLKVIEQGTRLILVGDVDQLPSVGPGNILRDIIKSECIKVVRLNEIFRQAQESAIVVNAHRINKGDYPILNNKESDFFFIRRNMIDDAENTIIELVRKRLPGFMKLDIKKDIQVLSPMRKSKLGITNLNKVLQAALNPPAANKNEYEYGDTVFRVGDKVMQLKNNYNITWIVKKNNLTVDEGTGIFNGDEGIICGIEDNNIKVLFDDNKLVVYENSMLNEIDLSYAVTIHKSQGSEYKVVVIPLLGGPPMLFNRNLLYTAVTRAKKLCVILGREEVLNMMVDNKTEIERFSSLDLRIREVYEFIQ